MLENLFCDVLSNTFLWGGKKKKGIEPGSAKMDLIKWSMMVRVLVSLIHVLFKIQQGHKVEVVTVLAKGRSWFAGSIPNIFYTTTVGHQGTRLIRSTTALMS